MSPRGGHQIVLRGEVRKDNRGIQIAFELARHGYDRGDDSLRRGVRSSGPIRSLHILEKVPALMNIFKLCSMRLKPNPQNSKAEPMGLIESTFYTRG